MKPYIAILYDSFLESIRSKVLWILLIAWTLILAALFPLSVSQGESYQFTNADIRSAKTILDQLAAASGGKGTRKQKAVYAKLDADFQGILKQREANKRRVSVGKLIESLNDLLSVKDLYDKDVWPTAEKREELKDLIAKKDNLSATELEMLNRGLIDLAFEGSINSSAGQASWITYAGIKISSPLPLTYSKMKPFIETAIFPLVMRLGLGIVAMFVAVIITSPMIPDMFQTGSMHLLLSKPISRNLLFLTKFVGGCTFVAVNICFLLVGLYIYAGTRLDIWNTGILWCIPLFIFMFMIFYSVSALVGLIWKNPIICVVVTAVFWGLCFGAGLIHFYFDITLNLQNQIQRVYAIGETPMVGTQQGQLQFWNEEGKEWKTAFGDRSGQKVLGPVWLESQKSIYFSRAQQAPFGINLGLTAPLELAHAPELADAGDKTFQSKIWDDGRLDNGPELPTDARQMFPWKDTLAVVAEDGIYRFDPVVAAQADQQKSIFGNFGMNFASNLLQAYPLMTPKNWNLKRPMDIAVSPSFQNVVAYSRGKIVHWIDSDNALKEQGRAEMDITVDTVAIVGTNDQVCIVCPLGAVPLVYDLSTMKEKQKLDAIGEGSFKQIRVDSQGHFYLLATDGTVWKVDANGSRCEKPSLPGQGKSLAIHVNEKDQLWIAHSGKRVDLVDATNGQVLKSFQPKLSVAEMIFQYVINPFYQVNPKPAAVNETIEYVLKNPKNKTLAFDRNDLDAPKVVADPWTPIWSNLAFVCVMLGISCWYLYRQDL
jgi:ABC-type transport system involved in multi-copper enzyme maturation permease subunit